MQRHHPCWIPNNPNPHPTTDSPVAPETVPHPTTIRLQMDMDQANMVEEVLANTEVNMGRLTKVTTEVPASMAANTAARVQKLKPRRQRYKLASRAVRRSQ